MTKANETSECSAQVPLRERLLSVPFDARLTVEHGWSSTSYFAIGRMCHEAAAMLEVYEKACEDVAGYVLVDKESREGVMFYSEDMKPDMATIKDKFELVTVYTHPQPTAQQALKPLTEEKTADLWNSSKRENLVDHVHEFKIAIESAHGITVPKPQDKD